MDSPKKIKASLRKSELADILEVHPKALQKMMNVDYYEELLLVNYKKKCILIPNIVVRKFLECYGAPLTSDDFI